MPSWSDLGHAMRRRMGISTSHLDSIGYSMNKKIMTPEEIIASAEHANSARRYVGMTTNVTDLSAKPLKGKLMPKKNTQAADPMYGAKANRKNVSAGMPGTERSGARYRVVAKMPSSDPVAAPTMANAKVIRSASGRQAPNFGDGMQSVR